MDNKFEPGCPDKSWHLIINDEIEWNGQIMCIEFAVE